MSRKHFIAGLLIGAGTLLALRARVEWRGYEWSITREGRTHNLTNEQLKSAVQTDNQNVLNNYLTRNWVERRELPREVWYGVEHWHITDQGIHNNLTTDTLLSALQRGTEIHEHQKKGWVTSSFVPEEAIDRTPDHQLTVLVERAAQRVTQHQLAQIVQILKNKKRWESVVYGLDPAEPLFRKLIAEQLLLPHELVTAEQRRMYEEMQRVARTLPVDDVLHSLGIQKADHHSAPLGTASELVYGACCIAYAHHVILLDVELTRQLFAQKNRTQQAQLINTLIQTRGTSEFVYQNPSITIPIDHVRNPRTRTKLLQRLSNNKMAILCLEAGIEANPEDGVKSPFILIRQPDIVLERAPDGALTVNYTKPIEQKPMLTLLRALLPDARFVNIMGTQLSWRPTSGTPSRPTFSSVPSTEHE
jgi:hypothetical protein